MNCAWCDSPGHIVQGRIVICLKHYRFMCMRTRAQRSNKTVPSYAELDILLQRCQMFCPACKEEMVWESKDNQQRVITLQHDRDGNLRLLCRSCNTRHSSCEGDTFYDIPKDHKICPMCKDLLPFDKFDNDFSGERFANKKTYCKECSKKRLYEWRRKNRAATSSV